MLSFVIFAGSADGASTSDAGIISAGSAPSSPITAGNLLSAVLGHFLSSVADDTSLPTVFGHFLSLLAIGSLLSIVFGCLLSLIASGGLSSIVFGYSLSLIADSCSLSAISGIGSLFLIRLSDSWALFLTNILFSARHFLLLSLRLFHSFLPSLPIPLICNSTPFTKIKLFD